MSGGKSIAVANAAKLSPDSDEVEVVSKATSLIRSVATCDAGTLYLLTGTGQTHVGYSHSYICARIQIFDVVPPLYGSVSLLLRY